MTTACSWPLGGLRRGVPAGNVSKATSKGVSNILPIQLRRFSRSIPVLRASISHLQRSQQQLAVCASSATALDADVSLGKLSPDGPIGQLGFSTTIQSDFYVADGKQLGKGAYGVVTLIADRRTGVEYACKALPKIRGSLTPARTAKKIWAEVNILSRLSTSDNVAKLHAVYEDATHVYLVQELCHGGDLDTLISDQGPFTERQAALVLYECLRVIAACHSLNVVHGDVKPANFLLKQHLRNPLPLIEAASITNWLKAIDFGCSQEVRGLRFSRRTGTPVYMAPEVFHRDYNEAADMWSLGMMLYQFLTGRLPFWSSLKACREQSLDEVAKSVCRSVIPLERGPFLNMSPEGLDLLQSLLERDPVKRLTSAEALGHPWFAAMRRQRPSSPVNNVVPLKVSQMAAPQLSMRRKKQPARQRPAAGLLQPPAANQQSVMRVGRSYPAPSAVGSLAY